MKSESVTTALAMQSLRLGLPIVARSGARTRPGGGLLVAVFHWCRCI
jgi:hypothetical protein